ncbi:MAG: SUMF1/EgtB/PvdO family nonheme iron enzyme [Planctomycetes bacterium]|nr:SUMF1/EgtB/PvdO family nonheme iron enzyme [Planctomycetota bacterium]
MTDPTPSITPEGIEDRIAIAFLEHFHADRAAGRETYLAGYCTQFPGHDARIAREWLLATGAPGPERAPDFEASGKSEDELGPYRLVRELGRGGQAVVYLADDLRVGRQVALKVLARDTAALSGQSALRFQREAEALARLDHPGIATVFDVGQEGARSYLAMRFIPGGSVQQWIAARTTDGHGPPRERAEVLRVARLVERAARALDIAHRAGILHRDIKPANLLLAGPDEPVLVDFGLASDDGSRTPTITMPGSVFGTLCYLAPERLAGNPADPRCDVYGLGCVLFELLALRRPHQAATAAAELRAIARERAPDVRTLNPGVPADLATVVATAVEPRPDARYQTARDFADDLDRVLRSLPIAARPAGPWTRLLRFREREPALATTLAALLGVLVVGLAVTTWLWRSERQARADVTRLADLELARELRRREATLWPARPDKVAAMRTWLAEGESLRTRLPGHAERLDRLPATSTDTALRWQHRQLTALVAEVRDLEPRLDAVRERARTASDLPGATVERYADAWRAVIERVRTSPRYGGLLLRPQVGLVPLGPDSASGLEEFAHALSGAIPSRDRSGKLAVREGTGVVLVLIPGGRAVLGADTAARADGRPANVDPRAPVEWTPSYVVDLEPYFLSKFELTQDQWQRHTGANPSVYRPGGTLTHIRGLQHPVELVSFDACARVLTELDLAVPTEAQWEWAYRSGTHMPYPYGVEPTTLTGHENLADRHARAQARNQKWPFISWLDDGHMVHAPVGSFAPNGFGLHDMGGNVKEWCADTWEDYPAVAPRPGDGLRAGENTRYRMLRGGSFASAADDARAAARIAAEKTESGSEAGVRPARRIER